ncbi:hypothetical protein AOQ84DRAFT_160084 [Glonium stellatum]|uniref:Uncharacterized protein n=1 Tax=Glonium stellatum TaxID=574774 RepID=A0A8E2ER72_9PEZI|nr:hypothetical protein AOQ84DRAFT_160084 [Glonium stellatum]
MLLVRGHPKLDSQPFPSNRAIWLLIGSFLCSGFALDHRRRQYLTLRPFFTHRPVFTKNSRIDFPLEAFKHIF